MQLCYSLSHKYVCGVSQMVVHEAVPRGPRDYLFCFRPMKKHAKCRSESQIEEEDPV
jgi:hypothetical protein